MRKITQKGLDTMIVLMLSCVIVMFGALFDKIAASNSLEEQ